MMKILRLFLVASDPGDSRPNIPRGSGRGAGGQFVFVVPSIDLVVVAATSNQGNGENA